jgi:seryl-tRNA synthetase
MNLNHLQQWISIDNQLKQLTEKMRELREKKNELTQSISKQMHEKSEDTILTTEGTIRLIKKREYENISFKYLEKWLPVIITDSAQSELLIRLLREKREIKETDDISLYQPKKK